MSPHIVGDNNLPSVTDLDSPVTVAVVGCGQRGNVAILPWFNFLY